MFFLSVKFQKALYLLSVCHFSCFWKSALSDAKFLYYLRVFTWFLLFFAFVRRLKLLTIFHFVRTRFWLYDNRDISWVYCVFWFFRCKQCKANNPQAIGPAKKSYLPSQIRFFNDFLTTVRPIQISWKNSKLLELIGYSDFSAASNAWPIGRSQLDWTQKIISSQSNKAFCDFFEAMSACIF